MPNIPATLHHPNQNPTKRAPHADMFCQTRKRGVRSKISGDLIDTPPHGARWKVEKLFPALLSLSPALSTAHSLRPSGRYPSRAVRPRRDRHTCNVCTPHTAQPSAIGTSGSRTPSHPVLRTFRLANSAIGDAGPPERSAEVLSQSARGVP